MNSLYLLLLLFLHTAASSERHFFSLPDPALENKGMKLLMKLLNAFNSRNFTEFEDFDVNFHFNMCLSRDMNSQEFLRKVREFRDSLPSGTVIKFALIRATSTSHVYPGIEIYVHTLYDDVHHDFYINFETIRLSTGDRQRLVMGWELNCTIPAHETPFPEENLRSITLS